MNSMPLLTWLYDINLDEQGIRFILFGFWSVHLLRFENIKSVAEIGRFSPGAINAYNFKNRLFARSFLIEMRRGWFTRKILITPKAPEEFINWLVNNGLEFRGHDT